MNRIPPASPDGVRQDTIFPDGESGSFHLFVYGTLRTGGVAAGRLSDCTLVTEAAVEGTLYDLVEYPALVLYGSTPVRGEIWRCPVPVLARLDEYERVEGGLFRRVARMVGAFACWVYVAGPALALRLTSARRLTHGDWQPSTPV